MYKYELCDYTLDAWITEKKHEPEWSSLACDLVNDLLTALDHLHEDEVLHCDLTVSFTFVIIHVLSLYALGNYYLKMHLCNNQHKSDIADIEKGQINDVLLQSGLLITQPLWEAH